VIKYGPNDNTVVGTQLDNGHIVIHGNTLADPSVIKAESDQVNKSKFHQ